jgi:ribosomal protein S18 acetylase RimI-like enzyme
MTQEAALIRNAKVGDLTELGKLAAGLVRQHHATDPGRFFLPERVEDGYASWLRREIRRPDAVVLVAELHGKLVGYSYGALEPRDWNALLDDHGVIHDVFVAAEARRSGVGRALLDRMVSELESRGAVRIILFTMVSNEGAQALFASRGFRGTMIEMARNKPEKG